jgi:GIY-YIG catalytic domain
MWYTRGRKIVVLGGACDTPNRIHLTGDVSMDTVPSHDLDDNPYSVYALIDPRDYTTRYIGITDDVYARFAQHLRCDGTNPEKDAWISELKAENVMLIMKTLEVVQGIERTRERETHWIYHYRFLGAHLFNLAVPTIRIASTPRVKQSKLLNDHNSGRKRNYEMVKELVLYRHEHGAWPEEVSADMCRKYEQSYFIKPNRSEQVRNPKMYEQRIRSYARGRKWIKAFELAKAAQEGA